MLFKLYLRLIVFFLFYLFDEADKLHVSAVKRSNKIHKPKDKISSTQDKQPIPDLNFPPPNEKEEVKSNDKKGRETYTERMERYEKMGILEEYRIAQRRRRREWQDKLSAEQRKEKSRKDAEVRKTKIAQSIDIQIKAKLISKKSSQRYYARQRAKKQGLQEKPEDALLVHRKKKFIKD